MSIVFFAVPIPCGRFGLTRLVRFPVLGIGVLFGRAFTLVAAIIHAGDTARPRTLIYVALAILGIIRAFRLWKRQKVDGSHQGIAALLYLLQALLGG
jgi:hypothetical protein